MTYHRILRLLLSYSRDHVNRRCQLRAEQHCLLFRALGILLTYSQSPESQVEVPPLCFQYLALSHPELHRQPQDNSEPLTASVNEFSEMVVLLAGEELEDPLRNLKR